MNPSLKRSRKRSLRKRQLRRRRRQSRRQRRTNPSFPWVSPSGLEITKLTVSINSAMQAVHVSMTQLSAALQQVTMATFPNDIDWAEPPEELTRPGPDDPPDVADYIYGYRIWRITPRRIPRGERTDRLEGGQDYYLSSFTSRPAWEEKVAHAKCLVKIYGVAQDGAFHTFHTEVPQVNCNCGLWAVYEEDYIPLQWNGVIGKVRGWGVVVEHELGFRAEHMEIVELYVPPPSWLPRDEATTYPSLIRDRHLIEEVGSIYDVPVVDLPQPLASLYSFQ